MFLVQCALTIAAAADDERSYQDQRAHYSFRLPPGWAQLSARAQRDGALQDLEGFSLGSGRGAVIFQKAGTRPFQPPFVLLHNIPLESAPAKKIFERLGDENLNRAMNESDEWRRRRISRASVDQPYYDMRRQMMFSNSQVDVQGLGSLKNLTVECLGAENVAVFRCHFTQADYDRDLMAVDALLDSFRYDSGYEFQEPEPPPRFSMSQFILRGAVIGAVIGGLIGLIVVVTRIEQRRRIV